MRISKGCPSLSFPRVSSTFRKMPLTSSPLIKCPYYSKNALNPRLIKSTILPSVSPCLTKSKQMMKTKPCKITNLASTVDFDSDVSISAIHPDILRTHIFTRLDGQTLASASCATSQLHSLSAEESLWRNICLSTWPSVDNPRMHKLITEFPNGSRSFFSDSFPLLISNVEQLEHVTTSPWSRTTNELISAVDLHYKNQLIFSKVQETVTSTGWFRCSPFRVDLLDPKDVVPTPIPYKADTCTDLEDSLTLSWIVVDPTGHKAANLSSRKPVSVQRHWLTGEIQVRFATILAVETDDFVQCGIVVTFRNCERGDEMQVREVSLQVEDMDGINLSGKDSLGILLNGLEKGERRKGRRDEAQERYVEYLRRTKEWKEKRFRREGRLDSLCVGFGVSILAAFWMFVMFS